MTGCWLLVAGRGASGSAPFIVGTAEGADFNLCYTIVGVACAYGASIPKKHPLPKSSLDNPPKVAYLKIQFQSRQVLLRSNAYGMPIYRWCDLTLYTTY